MASKLTEGGTTKEIMEYLKSKLRIGDDLEQPDSADQTDKDEPLSSETVQLLSQEGSKLFKEKKYLEALQKYDEAISASDNDMDKNSIRYNKGVLNNLKKLMPKIRCGKMHIYVKDLAIELFFEKEKFQEAMEEFSLALEIDPGYTKARRRRANTFKEMGLFSKALDDMLIIYSKEHEKSKQFTPETEALTGIILDSYVESELKKELELRDDITPPTHIIETFLRSFCLDPISVWWKDISKSPLHTAGQSGESCGFFAALRDLGARRYKDIIKHCDKELENENSKHKLNTYLLRATFLYLWGEEEKAKADLNEIIGSEDASKEMRSSASLKLGLQYNNRVDKCSEVYDAFNRAETLYPGNVDIYLHCSILLIESSRPVEAKELIEWGYSIAKDASPLFSALHHAVQFTTYFQSPDDRQQHLNALEQLEPTFDIPECYEVYAQSLIMIGETDKVEEMFQKAIAYNPDDLTFYVKRILTKSLSTGQLASAVEELEELLKQHPTCALAQFQIGILELQRGNKERAFEMMDTSIKNSHSFHELRERIRHKLEYKLQERIVDKLKLKIVMPGAR